MIDGPSNATSTAGPMTVHRGEGPTVPADDRATEPVEKGKPYLVVVDWPGPDTQERADAPACRIRGPAGRSAPGPGPVVVRGRTGDTRMREPARRATIVAMAATATGAIAHNMRPWTGASIRLPNQPRR